jgi:hypothetical protein
VGEGKHLRFRVRRDGIDTGSAIAFGFGAQLEGLNGSGGLYDIAFRLQENRWNGTVAPQLVVRRVLDGDDRYVELADWFRGQWKGENRDPVAQEIFDELGLESGVKRSLLESERFRALLAEPAALPAAA